VEEKKEKGDAGEVTAATAEAGGDGEKEAEEEVRSKEGGKRG